MIAHFGSGQASGHRLESKEERMKSLRSVAAAALVLALLGAFPLALSARANQVDAVVGLAYEAGSNALLKADARTLYRSSDGGKTWQKLTEAPVEGGQISSLAASPAAQGVLYVAGPGLGVLRSDDDGKTWSERNEGLPSREIIAVTAHTTQAETVYAVLKDQGIYRSQDGGKSWRLMDRTPQQGLRQLIHSNMAGSMQSGWLFAATAKGVRRVMDCFCLWQDAGKLGNPAHSVAYDPRQPEHLYTATEKGLFRSTDGGENWVEFKPPATDVVGLVITRSGALFAINAEGDLYRSEDQGDTWTKVNG